MHYAHVNSYSISKYHVVYVQKASEARCSCSHTTDILRPKIPHSLPCLKKMSILRRNLERQVAHRNISSAVVNSGFQTILFYFFFGKKCSSEV